MEELLEQLKAASQEMDDAETPGLKLNAWIKWVNLFKEKEALEKAAREDVKEYAL